MSTVNNGPQIVRNGLVLNLDAGNGKSYSTNRFQALGSGTITENVTFAINGTGTFQRVASGTVIGGYTVRPNDVVYSYVLGVTGCHYHGNSAPIPAGSYATFSVDYLITGATNIATSYPNNVVLVYENYAGSALAGSTGLANNYQDTWQRLTLTAGPTSGTGTQAMFLYPGYCSPGKLADSGTIYFRNPKVEWTNVDTGNSTFSSTSNIGLWYDLSGNGNNGTLTNGPTSNVSNKGNILFDGINQRVSTNYKPSGERSYFIWVKFSSLTHSSGYSLTGTQETNSYTYIGIQNGGDVYYYAGASTGGNIGNPVTVNTWVNLGFALFPDGSRRVYKNGIEIHYNTGGLGGTATLEFSVGCINQNHFITGNISNVTIYNRALSASEIMQNFQATKTRFGL